MFLYVNLLSSVIQMWLLQSSMSGSVLFSSSGSVCGSIVPDIWFTSMILLEVMIWGVHGSLLGSDAGGVQSIVTLYCPALVPLVCSKGLTVSHKTRSAPGFNNDWLPNLRFSTPNVHSNNVSHWCSMGKAIQHAQWKPITKPTFLAPALLGRHACRKSMNHTDSDFPHHAHIQNQFLNLTTADKVHYSDCRV